VISYKNEKTGEVRTVSFPWHWMFTPLCAIDLLSKGKIFHGLVGWIPLFTIIWTIKYKDLLGSALEKKGFTKELH